MCEDPTARRTLSPLIVPSRKNACLTSYKLPNPPKPKSSEAAGVTGQLARTHDDMAVIATMSSYTLAVRDG